MSRSSRGAHLYLRKASVRGGKQYPATWYIVDHGAERSTGFGAGDGGAAEKALADYIAKKHQPERRERPIAEIRIADIIAIYMRDVIPGQARPWTGAARAERLLQWWGDKVLADVTGETCRAYAAHRANKGGARRDLQDFSAAIGHHHKEGLHREVVRVVLPDAGEARQRWLTHDEAAKLLWVCWRTREVQEGQPTAKRPLRHLCRILLIGMYTGSRPGAIYNASWLPGPRRSHVDLDRGVFHRRGDGVAENSKRQTTVRLPRRLQAHMRRWRALDEADGRVNVVEFDGQPIASAKTALARAVTLAGLPGNVTAYTLRHTCASWLVALGVPTAKVADFLGTSEAMIVKHYGHLAPDYQQDAADAFGRRNRLSGVHSRG